MPLDITALGATGVHSLAKTNINLEDNFFYYNSLQAQSRPAVFTENSPWLVRNLTGTLGGITSGNLYFIRPIEGKGFSLSTTSGGTAVDLTSVVSGNVTFNSPYVYNNILNLPVGFSDRQAVKYYTNSTPLTGLTSGSTYYLKNVSNPGFGETALYSFTTHTFTSAGVTGRTAPTLGQLTTAYNASGATWATNTANFNQGSFQGYQDWVVPVSGTYEFEVRGAPGRASSGAAGGGGAIVKGRVPLTKGEIITIAVGQRGMTSSESGTGTPNNWPGASGGTFVVRKTGNVPLFIAGGGGGATTNKVGFDAAITTNGGLGESIFRKWCKR
jgi:hypothetical protein